MKELTPLQLSKAIARYNDLMETLAYEHLTIGTNLSEGTENWNLRDMVAECDYLLSTYFEWGHVNCDMMHGDEYERKAWRSETGKLRRFIKRFKPYITEMNCTEGHCSRYDTKGIK